MFGTIAGIFGSLGMKIAGGIAVAAVLLLGVQTARLSSAHASLERKTEQLGAEKLKLAVSNSSIALLEAAVQGKNDETLARATAYEKSKDRLLASLKQRSAVWRISYPGSAKLTNA
jgi:hypothetical protein